MKRLPEEGPSANRIDQIFKVTKLKIPLAAKTDPKLLEIMNHLKQFHFSDKACSKTAGKLISEVRDYVIRVYQGKTTAKKPGSKSPKNKKRKI